MPKGLALSLIQAITEKEEEYAASEIIADVGIHTLQNTEVLSLFSRRTDLEYVSVQ